MASVPPPPSNLITGPIVPSNILGLVGPILIGNLVVWLLLGVLTMQLYVYYVCFPKDRCSTKFSAYGLYVLDLVQTLTVTELAWETLCKEWGNPKAFMHPNWGLSMVPIVSGMISAWVQIFFALRVCALGRSPLWTAVTVVIVTISLAQAGAGIATGVRFAYIHDVEETRGLQKIVVVGLAGSAIADILIAASMVYFLVSASRRPIWRKAGNERITKLIRSTVETGVLSAAAASLDLGFFIGFPDKNLHTAIGITLSKLYSNALMASLNSRAGVYERPLPAEDTSGYCNTAQFTSVGLAVTMDDSMSMSETTVSKQEAVRHAGPCKNGDGEN